MTNKTIAERIINAGGTGDEAKFYSNDALSTGTEYEFNPSGIASYLTTEQNFTSGINQGSAVTSLTDSTGATPDDTVADIAQLSTSPALLADAADRTEVNTVLSVIENDISDLTTKLNALLSSLRTAGIIAT